MTPRRAGAGKDTTRADGWPLCPVCEEDELYSLIWKGDRPRPTMIEFLAHEMRCYRCNYIRPAQPPEPR